MEEDQYEDDTAAINAAVNRVIQKTIIGAAVVGLLAMILVPLGWA